MNKNKEKKPKKNKSSINIQKYTQQKIIQNINDGIVYKKQNRLSYSDIFRDKKKYISNDLGLSTNIEGSYTNLYKNSSIKQLNNKEMIINNSEKNIIAKSIYIKHIENIDKNHHPKNFNKKIINKSLKSSFSNSESKLSKTDSDKKILNKYSINKKRNFFLKNN